MQVEPSFWDNYIRLRDRRLPVDSNIYPYLERYYKRERTHFEKVWGAQMDRPIHQSSIKWYNELFSEGHETVRKLFVGSSVSTKVRRRADEAYGIQLKRGATLRDLLDLDIFGSITVNQDISPNLVLEGIDDPKKLSYGVRSDSHHFFFHRPQQTEFIFFHEIVVGYLLNRVENAGEIPARGKMTLADSNYPTASGYMLKCLANHLKMSEAQTVELHLQSSEEVRAALSPFVQELMLISSHIYWYLDVFAKKNGAHSPADLLRYVYLTFIVPSLERAAEEGELRMRPRASHYVDTIFFENLLDSRRGRIQQRNDSDVIRTLFHLAEHLWRPRKKRVLRQP